MTGDQEPPRLLRPAQAAEALNIDVKTLARWATQGRIHSIRLPSGHRRYYADVIDAIARGEQ
jgi:excisionase family DNA binding protein